MKKSFIDIDAARIALHVRYPNRDRDDHSSAQWIAQQLSLREAGCAHDERTVAIYEEWRKQT